MDFEEWFEKRHTKTGLYEKSLFGDDDALYLKHEMKKAFTLSQQSKQAEIDALQQQNQRLAMRLDVIQGVLQKQIDLIVELKNDT